MITLDEIRRRWIVEGVVAVSPEALLGSFQRVEALLGREWLEATLEPGPVGPAITLPIHILGSELAALENAANREALIARLRKNDSAAHSELAALAACSCGTHAVVEIEPIINVEGKIRIPDFRLRMAQEDWIHVEVTAANVSASQERAEQAATALASKLEALPDGLSAQVRFRREPTQEDLQLVARQLVALNEGDNQAMKDTEYWVLHILPVSPVLSPIGSDEQERPIVGAVLGRGEGNLFKASLAVRVPYTDDRAQQMIDAEAKQLPKDGASLICIRTEHSKSWIPTIERSFSPRIRRRISGVLLFGEGMLPSESGLSTARIGRFIRNPHARKQLPEWLVNRLDQMPRSLA